MFIPVAVWVKLIITTSDENGSSKETFLFSVKASLSSVIECAVTTILIPVGSAQGSSVATPTAFDKLAEKKQVNTVQSVFFLHAVIRSVLRLAIISSKALQVSFDCC